MAPRLKLVFDLKGVPELTKALSVFEDSTSNFLRFFKEYLVPTWYSLMVQQYATQGEITGERWAALTAQYAEWKTKHYPGAPVGVRTGAARASFTSPFDRNAYLKTTKKEMQVGTRLGYPAYLQTGTRKMVARPPMRTNYVFATELAQLLQRFAMDMRREAFGK